MYFILQSSLRNKNSEHISVQCTVANIHALEIQFVVFLLWPALKAMFVSEATKQRLSDAS